MEDGLDLEKQTSIPVEAELFFLTSLFIELIELDSAVGFDSSCIHPISIQARREGFRTMRNLTNIVLTVLLAISTEHVLAKRQTSPTSQGQASSSAAVLHIVTGCLVRTDHGYSLMTESSSYSIETEKDLAPYVNKQIIVTGIPEQHTNATPSTSRNAAVITDLRLRMVASVVGDCNLPSN
jgi:hypothetical protein